jgi:hypothetical protein
MEQVRVDLRRHPRVQVDWPVRLQVGSRVFHPHTMNLSRFGTKVRLEEPLEVGHPARLQIQPPEGRPLDVDAIVWRIDPDGPAFFFVGVPGDGEVHIRSGQPGAQEGS